MESHISYTCNSLFYIAIEKNRPVLIKAKHGAVAAEEIHCSEIGVKGNDLVVRTIEGRPCQVRNREKKRG